MTRRLTLALMVLALLATTAGQALSHEGHDHKVMGTVTMAAPDHVMLRDTDGKAVTVYLKSDTKVVKEKAPMKVADIKTNMRVVITAATETDKGKERMVAKTVELGAIVPAAK